jgi:putative ABC transport system substrate-binding protein
MSSHNRPGGNLTGVTAQSVQLTMKLVELMHDLLPDSRTIGILINPRNGGDEFAKSAQAAALRFGQRVVIAEASETPILMLPSTQSCTNMLSAL